MSTFQSNQVWLRIFWLFQNPLRFGRNCNNEMCSKLNFLRRTWLDACSTLSNPKYWIAAQIFSVDITITEYTSHALTSDLWVENWPSSFRKLQKVYIHPVFPDLTLFRNLEINLKMTISTITYNLPFFMETGGECPLLIIF
jgi:hypothetical protein